MSVARKVGLAIVQSARNETFGKCLCWRLSSTPGPRYFYPALPLPILDAQVLIAGNVHGSSSEYLKLPLIKLIKIPKLIGGYLLSQPIYMIKIYL